MTNQSVPAAAESSADDPMMSRWRDVWRGAWMTWAIFNALALVSVVVIVAVNPPSGMYAELEGLAYMVGLFMTAVISAIITTACAPLARALGARLKGVTRPTAHLAAFFCLGAVVGAIVVIAVLVATNAFGLPPLSFGVVAIVLVVMAAVGVSTAAGWAFAYWRSRRATRRASKSATS